jgi:hypothetical protein
VEGRRTQVKNRTRKTGCLSGSAKPRSSQKNSQEGKIRVCCGLQRLDVGSLEALGTWFNRELDLLTLDQRFAASHLDDREMDKNIRAVIALDEAETLAAVEPFDRADYTLPSSKNTYRLHDKVYQRGKCVLRWKLVASW